MYYEKELTERIIGAAIDVHKALGPGLLESAYSACLEHEFTLREIQFDREKSLPVAYKGLLIDCGYKLDFVVEQKIVLELKSVDTLHPLHEAQLLTYLKLGGYKIGLLMNFNIFTLTKGIRRMAL